MQISIECDPNQLEMILALSTPFLDQVSFQQPWRALPEALLTLGIWLKENSDLIDVPNLWNDVTWDLMTSFIETMDRFRDRVYFHSLEWADNFLDGVYQLHDDEMTDSDRRLTTIIKVIVEEIRKGNPGEDQAAVYTHDGIPLSFPEWADQILSGRVRPEQIERAHWGLIDPNRLIQLIEKWQKRQMKKNIDDIGF